MEGKREREEREDLDSSPKRAKTVTQDEVQVPGCSTGGMAKSQSEAEAEMLNLVAALDRNLLPCLPARELQAADRSYTLSHQANVEKYAREFMETAKKLQLLLIRVQYQHQPSREELLTKEIAALEAELKAKSELVDKQQGLIQGWQGLVKTHMDSMTGELERV